MSNRVAARTQVASNLCHPPVFPGQRFGLENGDQMRVAIVYLSGGGLSGGGRNTLRALVPRLQDDGRVSRLDVFVPPQAMSLPEVAPLSPRTWAAHDRLTGWRGSFCGASLRGMMRFPTAYLQAKPKPLGLGVHWWPSPMRGPHIRQCGQAHQSAPPIWPSGRTCGCSPPPERPRDLSGWRPPAQ